VIGEPAFHLLEVAFAGAFLRLLAGPTEAPGEQAAEVVGVVAHAKVPLDQGRHALGGPQVGGPAMGHGPFTEQGLQLGQLLVGQSRLGAQSGFGSQTARLTRQAPPATKGRGSDTQKASNDAWGLPSFDQRHGSPPAPFQLSCAPFWPHTSSWATSVPQEVFRR